MLRSFIQRDERLSFSKAKREIKQLPAEQIIMKPNAKRGLSMAKAEIYGLIRRDRVLAVLEELEAKVVDKAQLMRRKYWYEKLPIEIVYLLKRIRTIYRLIFHYLERQMFKTYAIYNCARCEDCGRNVHDFIVPDILWKQVYGSDRGVLCYDCFCERADRKFNYKWRMKWEKEGWKWYQVGKLEDKRS